MDSESRLYEPLMTGCAFLLPLVPEPSFALFFLGRCLARGSCRRVPIAISGVTDGECPAARMRANRAEPNWGKLTPVCGAFKCWNTFIYPPATWYDPIWIASPLPLPLGSDADFICRNNISLSDQRGVWAQKLVALCRQFSSYFLFLSCFSFDKLDKLAGSW